MAKKAKKVTNVDEFGFDIYEDDIDERLDDDELINDIVKSSEGPRSSQRYLNDE